MISTHSFFGQLVLDHLNFSKMSEYSDIVGIIWNNRIVNDVPYKQIATLTSFYGAESPFWDQAMCCNQLGRAPIQPRNRSTGDHAEFMMCLVIWGLSINRGTPLLWTVYKGKFMENPTNLLDDDWGYPFQETSMAHLPIFRC